MAVRTSTRHRAVRDPRGRLHQRVRRGEDLFTASSEHKSTIAARSTASVLTPHEPFTRRCAVTWAGLTVTTYHASGHTPAAVTGRW